MKTLGIIGGLGPMATAYFMELVTGMTDVDCDQKHIPIVLQSIPQTPDRTSYILDHIQKNPLPQMVEAGKRLKEAGQRIFVFFRSLAVDHGTAVFQRLDYQLVRDPLNA